MDASKLSEIVRVRRQRNLATVAAVFFMALGLAVALPHALKRRKELITANDELLILQSGIVNNQASIREVQAGILTAQSQIRTLIDEQQRKRN